MLNKDQSQEVGAGALAIQAGGNVIVGISAADARAIALDVAKATFYELTGEAREIMSVRVEEITEKVISKLEKEYPEGLKKAVDPDFQHALYMVQKQFGRTGDEQLGDLLVDLLVDRSKQDKRDILQIVLNESLEVAPKLTGSQISNLSLIFLARYTQNFKLVNLEKLGEYFDEYIHPLASDLAKNKASFQHLEFTGCGVSQLTAISLEEIYVRIYPALFSSGFDSSVLEAEQLSTEITSKFLMRCMNDGSKYQINCLNEDVLTAMVEELSVGQTDREKLSRLFNLSRMTTEQVREECIKLRPYMEGVFALWSESDMKSFSLTSVGMAIGHANVKRILGGEFSDLSIWIN